MSKGYAFTHFQDGVKFIGYVAAKDLPQARVLLQAARVQYSKLQFSLYATAVYASQGYPWRQLSLIYRKIRSGINQSRLEPSLGETLALVDHPKATNLLLQLRPKITRGDGLDDAFEAVMCPPQHAAVIAAASKRAQAPQALDALGGDCERRDKLLGRLRNVAILPVSTVIFGIAAFIGIIVAMGPKQLPQIYQYMKMTRPPMRVDQMSLSSQMGMWLMEFGTKSPLLFMLSVAGICGGVIGFMVFSKWARARIMDIPRVRFIIERSEMAIVWPIFALLNASGMEKARTASLLANASSYPRSRALLAKLALRFREGDGLVKAVRTAGFPTYVCSAVATGEQNKDLLREMNMFADEITRDVEEAIEKLAQLIAILSLVFVGGLVLVLAMVTMTPRIEVIGRLL